MVHQRSGPSTRPRQSSTDCCRLACTVTTSITTRMVPNRSFRAVRPVMDAVSARAERRIRGQGGHCPAGKHPGENSGWFVEREAAVTDHTLVVARSVARGAPVEQFDLQSAVPRHLQQAVEAVRAARLGFGEIAAAFDY